MNVIACSPPPPTIEADIQTKDIFSNTLTSLKSGLRDKEVRNVTGEVIVVVIVVFVVVKVLKVVVRNLEEGYCSAKALAKATIVLKTE